MELQSTKDKLLERVTGDNKVFIKRYELLRKGVQEAGNEGRHPG